MDKGKIKKAWFFNHAECEYFPCHDTEEPEDFNCLFCYCPLYALGPDCGGDFFYTKDNIKNCSLCILPHKRDSYITIIKPKLSLGSTTAGSLR